MQKETTNGAVALMIGQIDWIQVHKNNEQPYRKCQKRGY